jgi:site-specific recombinase XerC
MNNERNRKFYTVKGTKKEAERYLTEKLRELDTGIIIDTGKITVADFLDYWINESCRNRISITTLENYQMNIDNHIKKYLGQIELQKLLPLHLQNFYSKCLEKGLSNKTVLYFHRIIHRALEQAVKWQMVIRNVAKAVEPPKPITYVAKFLNEGETNLLIEKSVQSDIYIPVIIAVYTGMRRR